MRIAVIGQGYVGVTAAVCLAEAGHRVIGVEHDPERLRQLQAGAAPIYEPGLDELLDSLGDQERLTFGPSVSQIRGAVDAVIIAVGTPPLPSGGADLRPFADSLNDVETMSPPPRLIVVKSTVPPGTSERMLAEASPVLRLRERYVVSPEFLSLGSALAGWRRPSRIVAGLHNPALLPMLRDLYRGIEAPWILATPTSAETIKYASNAYLATKISFINEMANLCDAVGADIDEVARGMGADPRIGAHYLQAGVGYGGSCFPKDTKALAHLSSLEGESMAIVEAAINVNNAQRLRVVRMMRDLTPGASVAVLGLSFKPGTDDIREAPSLTVVSELLALGYRVRVWDPVVPREAVASAFPGAERPGQLEAALAGAQAAVVLTEWPEITAAAWAQQIPRMREPRLIIDGRNCLSPDQLRSCGASYRGIGRPLRR